MRSKLNKLYSKLKEGESWKEILDHYSKNEDVTTSLFVNVDNVEFEIAPVPAPIITDDKSPIPVEKVPGTSIQLPFLSLVIIPEKLSPDQLSKYPKISNALNNKIWEKIFRDNCVMGYGFWKYGLDSAKRLVIPYSPTDVFKLIGDDRKANSKLVSRDKISPKGGFWFNDEGVYYNISNSGGYSSTLSPYRALSKFIHKIIPYYPDVREWIVDNEMDVGGSENSGDNKKWWKGLATSMIKEGWNLLWEGELYTYNTSFHSLASSLHNLGAKQLESLKWPDNMEIQMINMYSRNYNEVYPWFKLLKNLDGDESLTDTLTGLVDSNANTFKNMFDLDVKSDSNTRNSSSTQHPSKPDSTYKSSDSKSSANESRQLTESLTYDQLVASTSDFWPTRFETVKYVQKHPPEVVILKDGNVDLTFNFKCEVGSHPRGSGRYHNGYIKFIPDVKKAPQASEEEPTSRLEKLRSWWVGLKNKVKSSVGNKKEVPKNIFSGDDLRKMKVIVSCDCEDFMYRFEMANVYHQAAVRTYSNGARPKITNKKNRPGICKHLLSCLSYLSSSVKIEAKDKE